MAPTGQVIEVDGVAVGLLRQGKGKPVLFIHGANGVAAWLPFFENLSGKYDLIIPDHPGFGRSDDPAWIRSVPDLAFFYLDLIEKLDLRDVHLVGTSMGGWIASEIAIRNESRLASLTVVGPAGVRIKGVPFGDIFMWSNEEATRNIFLNQAIADRLLSVKPTDEQLDVMMKNRFAVTKYGWQPRMFNPDLEKWLHRIKIPTFIGWGKEDKIIPSSYAERWKQRIPHAKVSIYENCGHLPHIEASDALFAEVKTFIDGVAV